MSPAASSPAALAIYLLRHGDARPDAIRRFVGRTDFPLNAEGIVQAEWWSRELAGIPFTHAYCSDLERSRETARIVCAARDLPLTIVPAFAEIDLGEWDGMPVDELRARHPREYAARGAALATYRPPGGESFSDLAARVMPAFEAIAQEARGAAGLPGPLLVVGHAGVNRVILASLLGMPLGQVMRIGQDYCGLNVIELAGDSPHGEWSVGRVNLPPGSLAAVGRGAAGGDLGRK